MNRSVSNNIITIYIIIIFKNEEKVEINVNEDLTLGKIQFN